MRILMLGNSFTTANHMPDMLAELTGAEIVQHTRGGERLADQTDWSAALNYNSAVETKDSGCFCSLNCMYKYCTWLNENSGIQIQITYIKECSSEVSAS